MPAENLQASSRDGASVDRAEIGLTPEQRALRRAVREFARAEIAPKVDELERLGQYPRELVREVGRLGYLGCLIPPEYGGGGPGYTHQRLVFGGVGPGGWGCAPPGSVPKYLGGGSPGGWGARGE